MEENTGLLKVFIPSDRTVPGNNNLSIRTNGNNTHNPSRISNKNWGSHSGYRRIRSFHEILFKLDMLPPTLCSKTALAVISSGLIFVALFHGVVMGSIVFICILSVGVSSALVQWLLQQDEGTNEMKDIALSIREGSDSFFSRVYGTIFKLSIPTAGILFFVYAQRKNPRGYSNTNPLSLAFMASLSFLLGAAFSALAGYVGLWVSVRANIRVAASASRNYHGTIQMALRSGGIAALIVVSMVVLGISLLLSLFCFIYEGNEGETGAIPFVRIPLLLVGFGFGASFVAIFSQLGGGIFTKAADVGADLVGKVEQGIPEDDPRNPAVIADLVGDNVGDCSARGADLFESISAEIISTMILAGTLCVDCGMSLSEQRGFILFPLLIHAFDLVVSSIGILSIRGEEKDGSSSGSSEDPLVTLKRGYKVSLACSLVLFFIAARFMLYTETAPGAWFNFFLCGVVGIISAYSQMLVTQYFTDCAYRPVKHIAAASTSGHATNVIAGLAVGMESVFIPVILMCVSILISFYLGKYSGLKDSEGKPNGGLFGTAVGTMGMLSTAVYVLAMDIFGPIADNAGGIVEMTAQDESVRNVTDRLDAVGNTTKATTKGYAVGSAALASFLLFRAFLDEVSDQTGKKIDAIDIAQPEVFLGGFLGAAMVFRFAAMAMSAVGDSAQAVVEEVRRQLRDMPGILDGTQRPQYAICVDVVSRAALQKMIAPGLLVTLMPVSVGLIFRVLGEFIHDDLLGPKILASFIMFTTVTGICLGLFLNNAGGAWDNTKKLIETGAHGGKGSEAHRAAITGDTVGDPAKDCAGPAIHVLIKLVANICMVLAPIFVGGNN